MIKGTISNWVLKLQTMYNNKFVVSKNFNQILEALEGMARYVGLLLAPEEAEVFTNSALWAELV